ncbi:MAG: type II toxin-antitoxin system RelE/ParE family toxin [Vicinamibacteraceae bacterium]
MIKSFRHKDLDEFFHRGRTKHIRADLLDRVGARLRGLYRARTLDELNVPGWRLHTLAGTNPKRYSLWVSGAWRITFEWTDEGAERVDLEQYH